MHPVDKLSDAMWHDVLCKLDAVSLTHMTAVSKRLHRLACDDGLWRDLMLHDRPSPMAAPTPLAACPSWAIHAPKARLQPQETSWRQAYRLSAMWERNRPKTTWPHPLVLDNDAPVAPLPSGALSNRRPAAARAQLFGLVDARHGPVPLACFAALMEDLGGTHFRVETTPGFTALRSSRGEVTVLSGRAVTFGHQSLRLKAQGRLCRELILLSKRATRFLPPAGSLRAAQPTTGHGQLDEMPHCITTSGQRIDAWHAQTARLIWSHRVKAVSTHSPPAKLHTKLLGPKGRYFFVAWGAHLHTTALDLNTGAVLFESQGKEELCGVSLLTPEAGPLVGWSANLHLRSWSLADAAHAAHVAPKRYVSSFRTWPVQPFATREIAVLGRRIYDIRADDDRPGRLIASVAGNLHRPSATRALSIDGWGTSPRREDYRLAGMVLGPQAGAVAHP